MEKKYKSFLKLIDERNTELDNERANEKKEEQIFLKLAWPKFISEYIPIIIKKYSKMYSPSQKLDKCLIFGKFDDIIIVESDNNISECYIKDETFFVPKKFFNAFTFRIKDFILDYDLCRNKEKEVSSYISFKEGIYLATLIDTYYKEMNQINNNTSTNEKKVDFFEEYQLFYLDYKYELSLLFYDAFIEKLLPLMFENYNPKELFNGYITCDPNYDKNLKNCIYIECDNEILIQLSRIIEEFNEDYKINHYLNESEKCTEMINDSTIKVHFANVRLLHDAYTVEFFAREYKENPQTYIEPFVGIKNKYIKVKKKIR